MTLCRCPSFPEVGSVFGKAGRAATATDPAPVEMFETIINLKPEDQWRPDVTVDRRRAAQARRQRCASRAASGAEVGLTAICVNGGRPQMGLRAPPRHTAMRSCAWTRWARSTG